MSSPGYYSQDNMSRLKKRKARFSFTEVNTLLQEVRKHRMVVVGKYNRGVPTDTKKQVWAEITARINEIGECQREVMEVIKKWSDLKCDTKRKVSAMRAGTVPNRGPNSRLSRHINATEKVVLQILEMGDDDQVNSDFGPLGDDDDIVGEEEEEEEEEDEEQEMDEEDSLFTPSSPNGGLDAPPSSIKGIDQSGDSSQPAFESQDEGPLIEDAAFRDSDEDARDDLLPSTGAERTVERPAGKPAETSEKTCTSVSNGEQKASATGGAGPISQDNLLDSTALSLQEQHATNALLETVSRSLELLSESVQQLAETQQEFVRESLQLQRDTVQVLRDFTGGAIALMHDRMNGRPAV